MPARLPRIRTDQRRARLAVRHHLAVTAKAPSTVVAAGDLVGFHATDPRSVYLEAWVRVRDATVESIQRELYEERSLLRMLAMRRTLFVVPIELGGVMHAACGLSVAASERRRLLRRLQSNGVTKHPERWLRDVEESTVRALRRRGEATAAQLAEDEPRLRTKIVLAPGKRYEAAQSVSFWVLLVLAADGRIVRGRPRGSWISRQYRWAPMEAWLQGGIPEWAIEDARAELVRRWLASFGPGTFADLKWWSGLTAAQVHAALAHVDTLEVVLDGGEAGLVLADDLAPVATPQPSAALLPPLDSTVMGWTQRDWFLGEHRAALFDRSGNAGPTLWWGGRIVGGWAQRADGEIAYRFLEDAGRDARDGAASEAERLGVWLGRAKVLPAFRTPLEMELAG